MANYLNIKTGEYPRHDGDLELLGWTVGDVLPTDWVEVEYVAPPSITADQTYQQESPAFIEGVWKMVWSVRNLTNAEKAEVALRNVRAKVERGEKLTSQEAALLIG